MELAPAEVLEGDARRLNLDDHSIEGIIFSPPYSFAIDYLANDSFHLNFMGVDSGFLRDRDDRTPRSHFLSEKYKFIWRIWARS
jgi:tRNA G10  N-methylase Trm11